MRASFNDIFSGNKNPIHFTNAPGRMDVMGGIADYSGSRVLQMAIQENTTVAIARRDDNVVRIKTLSEEVDPSFFEIDYAELLNNGKVDYAYANKKLADIPGGEWASYIVGCLLVLEKEKGLKENKGLDCLVDSRVPAGKGVSSSAALETAMMKALQQAFDISFSGTELPRLAQKVENLVVGAPCGLMDQLTSYFGAPRHLLPILCQPDLISKPIPVPAHLHFVGIDSGVRHAVGGSSYSDVRAAAFMGYSIIAMRLGVSNEQLMEARLTGNWKSLPFGGFLANIPVGEFEPNFVSLLPEKLNGGAFLEEFGNTIDSVTHINPDRYYQIKQAVSHPVYENERVGSFSEILETMQENHFDRFGLDLMGQKMYASHDSYSDCGLGTEATDDIVNAVRGKQKKGLFGARITGGGSGGTVCILCEGEEGLQEAKKIHQHYQEKWGIETTFFS